MTAAEIVRQLEPWLARHRRPAWRPVVQDGDGPVAASKFSGTPWVAADALWPDCGHCKASLRLFLQLDLGDLPEELGQRFGTGLLQLFYCVRDGCQGYGGWDPFGDDLSRVRVVHPTGPGLKAAVPQQDGNFPAKRIVGWTRFVDLPAPVEHEQLGLRYVYDHKAGTVRLACEELGLAFDAVKDGMLAEKVANSELGDKLGGWPAWIQNADYPGCPRCGLRMVHVFQVDSDANVPFAFGDAGCGHVTQCPDHKDVVAFGWACF